MTMASAKSIATAATSDSCADGGLNGFVAKQIARADAQRLAALPSPEHVEPFDRIVDGRKRRDELFLVILPIGRAALDLRDQPVKVLRRADEDVAELRRRAHHIGQHVQRAGIFAKVVEKHRAAAPRRDVLRDARDRAVRIRRFEDGRKQIRRETAERLARDEVVGHSAESARLPPRHRGNPATGGTRAPDPR